MCSRNTKQMYGGRLLNSTAQCRSNTMVLDLLQGWL
jgi:hypothetical protein